MCSNVIMWISTDASFISDEYHHVHLVNRHFILTSRLRCLLHFYPWINLVTWVQNLSFSDIRMTRFMKLSQPVQMSNLMLPLLHHKCIKVVQSRVDKKLLGNFQCCPSASYSDVYQLDSMFCHVLRQLVESP